MSANTWAPNMQQGGQYSAPLEKITVQIEGPGAVALDPDAYGLILPGLEATAEYPNELWSLTGNLSVIVENGDSISQIRLGWFDGADPQHDDDPFDPRRLSQSRYDYGTTAADTVHGTTWWDQIWVRPRAVGVPQAFSIFMVHLYHPGKLDGLYIVRPTARFTLERFRLGPDYRETAKRYTPLPIVVPP